MTSEKAVDPYEGMRTRRHWKREDATRVLTDWAESGESMTAFTRRHQLSTHRLQWWRTQLAQQNAAGSEQVRLMPVVPRQAPLIAIGAAPGSAVSVTVSGTRIDVSDVRQTDPRWLATLVVELRRSPS